MTLLLQNNAEVNRTEKQGHTPLFVSAQNGRVEVVRALLLHSDIDIDYADFRGITPLWAACQNNHSEVVELMLNPPQSLTDVSDAKSNLEESDVANVRKGADANLAMNNGCTSLWIAASRGSTECIALLIKYGADINKIDRSSGGTPLFVACQNGKESAGKLRLAANANVNEPRTGDGTTPLIMAAHNGHSGTVQLLLKSGADVMMTNTNGWSAFGCAAQQGHCDIVKLLHGHMVKSKSTQEIVKLVNVGDADGWTPLHLACQNNHPEVVELLLNPPQSSADSSDAKSNSRESDVANVPKGADPNLAMNNGCTPLWVAASRGSSECIALLIKYAADINKIDRSTGGTPLFVACQNGKESAVKLLLAANANVNEPRTGD